jgi:DNA polymerase bacteriophage-type
MPPREDGTLVWADYSSVEARGVAWLAGQDDLVEAFRSGAKIYEDMASSVFNRPASDIGKDSFERFVGKGLVLGAGYQMGGAKFALTCAKQGRPIDEVFAFDAIAAYRARFPKIKKLWFDLEEAAVEAVRKPGETFQIPNGKVRFSVRHGWLIMRLPTGSFVRYRNPRLEPDPKYDRDVVTYDGVNSLTKKWGTQKTYGGRITENAVQRICRDIVASSLVPLEDAGYLPILLVHDEIITITSRPDASPDEVAGIMCRVPAGLEGFPLAAEAKIGRRYSK